MKVGLKDIGFKVGIRAEYIIIGFPQQTRDIIMVKRVKTKQKAKTK